MIVGPSYSLKTGQPPRQSVPQIQKYDTSELVNQFLADPTRSLPFDEDEDRVHALVRKPGFFTLSYFDQNYPATETRRLFLDTHKRFYLVVCEVHCDAVGFPGVDRNAICEAGFVIRRRTWTFGKNEQAARAFESMKAGGLAGLETFRGEARKVGGDEIVEWWKPDPKKDGVGSWKQVPNGPEPNIPVETIYPLYPLIPDPRDTKHAAAGKTIYFGLIPTASTELDPLGRPRFDDGDVYEIRTFVRQHHFPCPKTGKRNDCQGPLVWSPATEVYQVAAPFDLIGTSYRTINVKTPHLKTLKAQAAKPRIGLRAPVRFNLPPESGPELSAMWPPVPSLASGICFRNIPLTTIVAMFAYNILKPIVVRIFQLYYLEPLEFCIPPAPTLSGIPELILPAPPSAVTDAMAPLNDELMNVTLDDVAAAAPELEEVPA